MKKILLVIIIASLMACGKDNEGNPESPKNIVTIANNCPEEAIYYYGASEQSAKLYTIAPHGKSTHEFGTPGGTASYVMIYLKLNEKTLSKGYELTGFFANEGPNYAVYYDKEVNFNTFVIFQPVKD